LENSIGSFVFEGQLKFHSIGLYYSIVDADVLLDNRGGSGFLHRCNEWSFCLMAARMAAEQERR
jgi:hypothetical protein